MRRFNQIMINLVKNAVKFTKSGKIEIKANFNFVYGCLVVHIKDSGVGIA